jgi:hypothetical protein
MITKEQFFHVEFENTYDQYVASLEQKLPKVDPNLVHRVMYLERKLSTEYIKEPQVTLMVEDRYLKKLNYIS